MATLGRPEVIHAERLFEITEAGRDQLREGATRKEVDSQLLRLFSRGSTIFGPTDLTAFEEGLDYGGIFQAYGFDPTRKGLERLLSRGFLDHRKPSREEVVDESLRVRAWHVRGRDLYEELSGKYKGTPTGYLIDTYWKLSNEGRLEPRELYQAVEHIRNFRRASGYDYPPKGIRTEEALIVFDNFMSHVHENGWPNLYWDSERLKPDMSGISLEDAEKFTSLLDAMSY